MKNQGLLQSILLEVSQVLTSFDWRDVRGFRLVNTTSQFHLENTSQNNQELPKFWMSVSHSSGCVVYIFKNPAKIRGF